MKKLLSIILLLFLAACASAETTAPAVSTAPPEPETAVSPPSPAANANDTALQSGVIAGFPAKDAAEASIVRERDWKKGAEEPAVTIIEYGDFQ